MATSACTINTQQVSTPGVASSPAAVPTHVSGKTFDGTLALRSVQQQVALGPRITATEGNRKLGDQIKTELAAHGWTPNEQVFPYRGVQGRNVWGVKGQGEIVILGAHYDTRRYADQDKQNPRAPVPGANDGASGTAVLLELARALDFNVIDKQVWLVFFDAEDNGEIDGWEWIVGSSQFAASMTVTPTAVIVVDMIGDAQQEIFLEQTSNPVLSNQLWEIAARLGYAEQFRMLPKWSMIDDHTPFLRRGFRAVDIIDFDYPYWHTTQDTPDKVSAESLHRVGRVVETWLERR